MRGSIVAANDVTEDTAKYQPIGKFMVMTVPVMAIVTVTTIVAVITPVPVVVAVGEPVLNAAGPTVTVSAEILGMVRFQIVCTGVFAAPGIVAFAPFLVGAGGRQDGNG